jgi:GDP-L-fucose synthase
MYPAICDQPITEDNLDAGMKSLDTLSAPYATARHIGRRLALMDDELGQLKDDWFFVIPSTYYGGIPWGLPANPGHAVEGIFHKISTAMKEGRSDVELLGSPDATRDFIHIDDLADGLIALMKSRAQGDDWGAKTINIGPGSGTRIGDLAEEIAGTLGYTGNISFSGKYTGTMHKVLSTSLLNKVLPNWNQRYILREGLKQMYSLWGQDA